MTSPALIKCPLSIKTKLNLIEAQYFDRINCLKTRKKNKMSRFILVCSLLVLGNFVYSIPFSTSVEDLGSGELEENSTKILNGSGPDL